jgi:CheY-like chemotaxis protein
VSGDIEIFETLSRFMEKEAMRVERCPDISAAPRRLCASKFEAVVLDFRLRAEALELLKNLRQTKLHKAVVVIAILNDNDGMPGAFRAGASFALERPLSAVTAMRTLRAAYPLMVRERSRYFRCPLQIPACISIDSRPEFSVTSVNISEGGMGIANAPALELGARVVLRLKLPGFQTDAKINAVVCWRDEEGRAGLEFTYQSPQLQAQLSSWLADRLAETVPEDAVPSV